MPLFKFTGKRPSDLGVRPDGQLKPCPSTPNCVSSQAPTSDTKHYIAPLAYPPGTTTPAQVIQKLKQVIKPMKMTTIVESRDDYLYAEFMSGILGFVDDVEFSVKGDADKVVHVRSASRIGRSDLGKNRKRMENIRKKLSKA